MEEIVEEDENKVLVKVNVDECRMTALKHNVIIIIIKLIKKNNKINNKINN